MRKIVQMAFCACIFAVTLSAQTPAKVDFARDVQPIFQQSCIGCHNAQVKSGDVDLMTNADIRPEDYAAFKRASDEGRLRLIENGVGLDPNLLWFNLTSKKSSDPKSRWFGNKAFRQAMSCAVDRQAIVNTVYLGEAIPIYGPVTPANRTWFADVRPACEHDPAKARTLFASAGLTDRNGDGVLEDATGKPVRFSVLTQADHIRARVVAVIQEQLRQVGIVVDVVPLDPNALFQRFSEANYDSIYFGIQASATDPALNASFWFSSGVWHVWNPAQKTPANDWERRMEDLMTRNATSPDQAERVRSFRRDERSMSAARNSTCIADAPKVAALDVVRTACERGGVRRRWLERWRTWRTVSSAPVTGRRLRSAIARALESRASNRVRASSDVCDSR